MAKDVWKSDFLNSHKLKGKTAIEKRANYVRSQGGNEWDVKGFDRFMDYRTARQKMYDEGNSKANKDWSTSHEESLAKQREKEKKDAEAKLKKMEQERKQKKAEQDRKRKQREIEKNGLKENSFLNDMLNMGKVGLKSALTHKPPVLDSVKLAKQYADKGVRPNDATKELSRGITRTANTFGFGAIKEMSKNDPYYQKEVFNERKGGAKAADFAYDALGYLVPASKAYGTLNASKAGKALTNYGSKSIGKRLVSEGVKGAAIGNVIANAEVGTRELINPNDYNWKDNAKHIGFGTGMGAVADPLFYGAGKGIAKGFETASSRTMKNLLPKNEAVANQFANEFKSYNAGPYTKPNHFALNDLIPKGNNITKPNFLPNLKPKVNMDIPVPKVGDSNLPPITEDGLTLAERLQMMEGKRVGADFSNSKPIVERSNPVNQYGVEIPYDKVQHAPPAYWRGRYEEFVNFVNKNYDSNQLNKEALDDLWSQFAKYDEPVTLEEAVDLAYKNNNDPVINAADVWDKLGNRPPVSKQAKEILFGAKKNVPPVQELTPKTKTNNVIPTLNSPKSQQPVEPLLRGEQSLVNEVPQQPNITEQVPKQETIVKQTQQPKLNERSFYNTVRNPEKLSPEMEQLLNDFDKTYKPMSNEETVKFANKYVAKDMEKAYQFVKNARKFDPRHITVGHRLIDELQKAGQYDKALDVVERLAEQGTKAGQSIQSYSIYNRLTAEGQLVRAQRHINKINQDITDPAKQVKLTPQHVEDISQTADSIQKFAGQMEQANNVMKIMENVKKGKVATDSELETVRSFVTDAKKFFGDLAPNVKEPKVKPVKDVRTRDKVVDFMSKKEDVARKELQKIFGRANSMPVDAFYHLSVIGASKIAKGTVKLADFTEEMAKEFGDTVRPYAKQIYNKAVETFNLQSESMTRQRLSEVEKITNRALKDKNLTVDEVDTIKEFARRVGQMSGDAKLEASMELQTTLQALERPTFGRKLSAAQTISQLLNPKTIVRNAVGNEMFYRVEQMNKLLATPIDMVRSKITGGERTITFVSNNQGQYWRNWLTGAKAGWKGVNPMGLQTMYDIGPQAFRSKWNPLTYLEKSLGATLRSFDHAGYMRAYNKTLGELATLRAINQGLKGQAKKDAIAQFIREADENMIQMADQYGKYATFQDNTVLSNALQKVKKGMNKVSTLGTTEDFGLGDMVLKYPKTPGNLVMRALEYSPAGVVRSAHLLKTMAKTKDPVATRDFYLSLTRAITGTAGFSLLGYVLADKGILTSAGNSDYEIANLERMAGKQPNSVNISALQRFVSSGFNLKATGTEKGDTFVSYDWAQPISIAIALGTGVNQSKKENNEQLGIAEGTKGALDSAGNTIIQSSVLKGVNDFLANYPGRTMSDRFGDAAKGIVSSFVPTLSNQVRQINSNTARTTYSPKLSDEILNRATNRIPGLDNNLPPSYDTLGNKRQTFQGGTNNLLNVFLNPAFVSKYNPSEEAQFLLDYINETGDKRAAPRMADKKIDGTPLTGEQYAELQRIIGQETQKGVKELIPKLKNSNDTADKGKQIYNLLNAAGKKGKGTIRDQLLTKEQLAEAKKNGLDEETIKERIKKGWTLTRALTTPNK